MKRFLPSNLAGQLALVMAGALLVASAINFVLLIGERQRSSLIEQSGPAIARFVDAAEEVFARPPVSTDRVIVGSGGRPQGGPRYQVFSSNTIDNRNLPRDGDLERRLKAALANADVDATDVRAATRSVTRPERGMDPGFGRGGPPPNDRFGPPPTGFGPPPADQFVRPPLMPPNMRPEPDPGPPRPMREAREIMLAAQLPDGRWLSGATMSPEPTSGDVFLLGVSTVVTFGFVLVAALWIVSRLSRPLKDLAGAASRVGAASEPEEVVVRGPGDVRQTLTAFNAMSRRVSQLLGEKDVMLGALGHDLRTPLASLRIRIESMEPEAERLKAIRTIEEANELLEDILELARQGKSKEPVQAMDISILVEDIVEDYSETGAPVSLTASQKAPVACRPVLFRRALRNLIDNAVAYGERARLSVARTSDEVLVRVEDDGPGMSEEALRSAANPFYRGDASRNRGTGGAGLGLTLADAIAKAHGGSLQLLNGEGKGLVATIRLPLHMPNSG